MLQRAVPTAPDPPPLLVVEDLSVAIPSRRGIVRAVDGVSFTLRRGETLGIVGESGSGKSMLALALTRLVPVPGRITGGRVVLDGEDMARLSEREMRHIRGSRIGMVFQDPTSSLNPVLRIGTQVGEALSAHRRFPSDAVRARSIALLKDVRIPAADLRIDDFPHQFSGGMRQRVMIAIGMANRPDLLIADEPTTALDVTVQAQIIDLLRSARDETGAAIVFISHNIALVSQFCSHVMVMYAGRVVERGPAAEVFADPRHPYTAALLRSVPRQDRREPGGMAFIAGQPPDLAATPPGCAFAPRCQVAVPRSGCEMPPLFELGSGRAARCWRAAPDFVAGDSLQAN